jgi:hypothetical protein
MAPLATAHLMTTAASGGGSGGDNDEERQRRDWQCTMNQLAVASTKQRFAKQRQRPTGKDPKGKGKMPGPVAPDPDNKGKAPVPQEVAVAGMLFHFPQPCYANIQLRQVCMPTATTKLPTCARALCTTSASRPCALMLRWAPPPPDPLALLTCPPAKDVA